MRNEFFFQIDVSEEQVALAHQLVEHSILHHPVEDIFAQDPDGKARQREFRFTGTLGEIVFADTYGLERPAKSFGAVGGQDFGQDFKFSVNGEPKSFDLKSMSRKDNHLRANYVLNLPAYQMQRDMVVTDYYFCISFHKSGEQYVASFIGYASKAEIQAGTVGILYTKGTKRVKDNGGFFIFQRDTYEVDFKDLTTPPISADIRRKSGFQEKKILPAFVKS